MNDSLFVIIEILFFCTFTGMGALVLSCVARLCVAMMSYHYHHHHPPPPHEPERSPSSAPPSVAVLVSAPDGSLGLGIIRPRAGAQLAVHSVE